MFHHRSIALAAAVLCLALPLAAQRTRPAASAPVPAGAGRVLRPAAEEVVGQHGSNPGYFSPLGSKAYFIAGGPEGWELRWTDGVNVGLVIDLWPGSWGAAVVRDIGTLGNNVYFFAETDSPSNELWKSDGTAGNTVKVKNVPGATPFGFWPHGNLLYFTIGFPWGSFPVELWRTDGTADGTFMIKSFPYAGNWVDGGDVFGNFTSSGNYFYFTGASETSSGGALYRTDGTVEGTIRLRDGSARHLIDLNGTLYFCNAGSSAGLWKSNGTVEGTVQVRPNFSFDYSTRAGDYLYFRAVTFNQLWKSDGTNGGTTLVKDFSPYPFFVGPRGVGSRVFMAVRGTSGGYWLAASDGSTLGTVLLKLIQPWGDTHYGMAGGDLYYFTTQTTEYGYELWRSDATPGGTFMVKDIDWRRFEDGTPYSGSPTMQTYWNGLLLFSAYDVHGNEPWRTDGTTNGTFMLANLQPDGTFAGRVTDANGGGIAGAMVSVWRRNNDGTLEKATDYPVDAQGYYSAEGLSAGTYIAKVEATGYTRKFYNGQICGPCPTAEATGIPVAIGVTTSNIDFSLERTGAITGVVRNAQTQAGAGGITVNFSASRNGFVQATAVTDGDGRYTTPMTLPPGVYAAWTTGTTSYAASEYIGFYCGVGRGADDFTPIPVEPAQTTQSVDFVVNPGTP